MNKVLVIINPVAGRKKLNSVKDEVVEILKNDSNSIDVVYTEYIGHAVNLASEAKKNGYDSIVCCGGDGTLNEVFTGILRTDSNKDINIGYIPCGSTNDFAETLELSSDPVIQAENIAKENLSPIDVGKFGKTRFFSYIASFGALTEASYSAPQKVKNILGHFAYILEGMKDFFKIKPVNATIIADGKEYKGTYLFGACSNTLSVGGLVKLSRDIVDIHDGLFEVLLVKYPKNIFQVNKILKGALESDFKSEMFDFFRAKEIEMIFDEDIAFTLDGEKATAFGTVRITNLEKAVTLYK